MNMFMKIAGIIGDSKVDGHIGDIELLSLAFDQSQRQGPVTPALPSPGNTAARDVYVTIQSGPVSNALFTACAANKTFPSVVIMFERSSGGDKPQPVSTYLLKNVFVSAFQSDPTAGSKPTDSIGFHFETMVVKHGAHAVTY